MIRAAALALALLATPAMAQDGPAEAAQSAADRLEEATRLLSEARGGRARVDALTETVRAYEDGLVALRDGLRRAAVRERAISLDFEARRAEMSRLLGVLTTISDVPSPLLLLHPSGPTGTARSGMILSDAAPALQAEVEALRATLEELALLQSLQESAADTLRSGLSGAQEARAALSQAIADRTDLPRRYYEDEEALDALIESTETLGAFASGLAGTVASVDDDVAQPDAAALRGTLSLPVQGTLLRRFGEADAAGIARPGWLIATRPRALVTAPAAATVRYAGPLLDMGNVVILEPAPDVLFVFSGLAEAHGRVGDVVPRGAPVGLMGGTPPEVQDILTESAEGVAAQRTETLYVEVRDGQDAVDPGTWFAAE